MAAPAKADMGTADDPSLRLGALRTHPNVAEALEDKSCRVMNEMDKSGNKILRRWIHTTDDKVFEIPLADESKSHVFRSIRDIRQFLSDAFLPIGFPDSVSSDYLAYQTYDSLQAFFSTITSLLANRAILQGLGVGDANTTATYALLLTIFKDGISRVATIMFAYRFGLTIEPECKKYRFLADIFNDSAFFLDLFSPYFNPWAKLLTLTGAEALRAMCGVAAGASKAALSSHFAKQNNLAELNAKEASQETAVGLVGLAVGSVVVKYVESRETVFYLMILLVFVHLWMNYRGVRCVKLEHLNRQRATIVMQHFIQTQRILTPQQVADRENIVFWSPYLKDREGKSVAHVSFARSYGDAIGVGVHNADIDCIDEESGYGFKVYVWRHVNKNTLALKILLFEEGHPHAATVAWFCAVELAWSMASGDGRFDRMKSKYLSGISTNNSLPGMPKNSDEDINEKTSSYYRKIADAFLDAGAGWHDGKDKGSLETAAPFRIRGGLLEERDAINETKKSM